MKSIRVCAGDDERRRARAISARTYKTGALGAASLMAIMTMTLVATVWPVRALAADKAEALIRQGLDVRRSGDDQGAYLLLKEAHEISRSPRTAAQLGFCEQALGRWADADVHLSEALKAPSDPWVRKNREVITQALGTVKTHVARIEVLGDPAGAEVSINGNAVGRLPLASPVRVAEGEIVVELKMIGYARASKSLRVVGGQYQQVLMRAEREQEKEKEKPVSRPEGAGDTARPPGDRGGSAAAGARADEGADRAGQARGDGAGTGARVDEQAITGGGTSGLRVAAWVTAGASVAMLALGAIQAVSASSKLEEFGKTMADSGAMRTCGTDLPGYGGAQCASLHNGWKQDRTISLVGFIGGGVLAAAATTMFILSVHRSPDNSVAVACAPDLRSPGIGCLVRF